MMVIDGLNFDEDITQILENLQALNQEFSTAFWFAMQTHRDEAPAEGGYPVQLETRKEIFDKALFLKPVNNKIQAVVLKDGNRTDQAFMLDPATMMLVEEEI